MDAGGDEVRKSSSFNAKEKNTKFHFYRHKLLIVTDDRQVELFSPRELNTSLMGSIFATKMRCTEPLKRVKAKLLFRTISLLHKREIILPTKWNFKIKPRVKMLRVLGLSPNKTPVVLIQSILPEK